MSRWKSHPDVVAILANYRERLRPEMGRVVANLIKTATTKNDMASVQAARVLLETFGEFAPARVEHQVTLAAYVAGRLVATSR